MNREEALSFIRRQDIDIRVRHQESQKIKRSIVKGYKKSTAPRSISIKPKRATEVRDFYPPLRTGPRISEPGKFFSPQPSVPRRRY